MMNILTQFGAEHAESGGLFAALGIDWKMLVLQIISFVVLAWLLGKFVYPVLMQTVDAREAQIEAGVKAASEAEARAAAATKEVEAALKEARKEATAIVTTAKEEAAAAIEAASAKASARAEQIIDDAQAQLQKDIAAAKKSLHNETIELVALATEKVIGKTVDVTVDQKVIGAALKEAQ